MTQRSALTTQSKLAVQTLFSGALPWSGVAFTEFANCLRKGSHSCHTASRAGNEETFSHALEIVEYACLVTF
ncbi:hypothetical protein [Desulfosporosinus fructosivorans]